MEQPIKKHLRIGMIGAGAHSSQQHGPALRALRAAHPDEVELAVICDLDLARAQAYAAQFGFARACTDWRAMLAEESLDGLIAVTPLLRTCAIVGELLPRRIPLLVEKPPGQTAQEAAELAALARSTGTANLVSFNRRFHPAVAAARQWLAENARDNPPRLLLARMLRGARREPDFMTGTGIHAVDTLLSFEPGMPQVSATRIAPARPGAAAAWLAQLRFDNGVCANLAVAPDCGRGEETYELCGADYQVRIDTVAGNTEVWAGYREVFRWSVAPDAPAEVREGAAGETEHFLRALQGKAAFSPNLDDALRSMQVAETIASAK